MPKDNPSPSTFYLPPPTRMGTGINPDAVTRTHRTWNAAQVVLGTAELRHLTEWNILDPRPTVILHLSGVMDTLETELEGHGGSSGAALAGEIWTIPAGTRYRSQAQGGTITYAALYFNSRDGTGPFDIHPLSGVRNALLFKSVLLLARRIFTSSDVDELSNESLIEVIRSQVFTAYGRQSSQPDQPPAPHLNAKQIRLVRGYIHDMLPERIALQDLASLLQMTPHRLLIAFRRSFGVTPGQYVITQRLRCAQRLLAYSMDDITSIALNVGFSSHSHLSYLFRKRFGQTPSDFRQQFQTFVQLPWNSTTSLE